jgi:hypothetical protein
MRVRAYGSASPNEAVDATLSEGSEPATIRPGRNTTISVSLDSTIASIEIKPAALTLCPDPQTVTPLEVIARNANGVMVLGGTYTWSSSNPGVAKADTAGNVHTGMQGTAILTAIEKASGKSATTTVNVLVTVAALSLNPAAVCMGDSSVGTVTLSCPVLPGSAVIALSSSNPKVVSLPSTVTIPAGSKAATFNIHTTQTSPPSNAAISATITATYNGSKSAVLEIDPLLRITRMRILYLNPNLNPKDPKSILYTRWDSNDQGARKPDIGEIASVNAIEVTFAGGVPKAGTVDRDRTLTVKAVGTSFALPGVIEAGASPEILLWVYKKGPTIVQVPPAIYLITLVGDGPPAITTAAGCRLDGELNTAPLPADLSGNGKQGGDFIVKADISDSIK